MREATAIDVRPTQQVRIEDGPNAGHVGVVRNVTLTVQFGSNLPLAIIDFGDATTIDHTVVRSPGDPVTILNEGRWPQ